jgi:hypothetical protein
MGLETTSRLLEPTTERAGLVSSGLKRLGIRPGSAIGVLICAAHEEDRAVAQMAIAQGGYGLVGLNITLSVQDLTFRLISSKCKVLFACAEGVERWRLTGVPMRVIGEGVDIIWWRALELRERAASPDDLRTTA